MRSRLYEPSRTFLESDRGLVAAFVWGLAEALFWPVVPDFMAVAAGPAAPKRWWRLGLFLSAGSVVGGGLGYWFASVRGSTVPLEYLPLVTEGMIHQAGVWLASEGPSALIHQPLSGVPYKVFVYLSGSGHLAFVSFVWWSTLARAGRIFASAALGGALGAAVPEGFRRRFYDVFLLLFTTVFALGLRAVMRAY